MKKIYYRKLIRDKIPQRIRETGGECEIVNLSDLAFKKELLRKVGEEAIGVSKAKDKKEIVSEMGDLLDVIKELKKVFNIDTEELSNSRKKEFKRKGGFNKKIFLVWSEDTGYRTNEKKGKGR